VDIDQAKVRVDNVLLYKLSNANVYTGDHGYTFSKFLDETSANDFEISAAERESVRNYLETQLQSNSERFEAHVNLVKGYCKLKSAVLDVGCGGGAFLTLCRRDGFECFGIEPDLNRAEYAEEQTQAKIFNQDIASEEFIEENHEKFDCVTFWDVIEHVNFPSASLKAAARCLKKGGVICLDTPAKDSFYHKTGQLSYKLSFGRFPLFLNIMYSEHPFGHKQIFSTLEMKHELEKAGFTVLKFSKIHELTFPVDFYLKKMLKLNFLVTFLKPIAQLFFKIIPIRNKMVVVAVKN
jgi:2-polyprenyl-3-methyl-5-hydroxy-6-metoxy-1,4-benzoquinol methylase